MPKDTCSFAERCRERDTEALKLLAESGELTEVLKLPSRPSSSGVMSDSRSPPHRKTQRTKSEDGSAFKGHPY